MTEAYPQGWGQPQPPTPPATRRPWYKKKRYMLPIGTLTGLTIIGSFIDEPVDPAIQQPLAQVVETSTVALSPTAESTADADALAVAQAEALAAKKAKAKRVAKAKALKAKKLKAAKLRKARQRAAAAEERRRQQEEEEENTSVYYANCTAVRAAGAAPIRRGEPGYASHLDRDGDGIACDT